MRAYISYMERYPLYSTLLVLEDYEKAELYEECAIIRDALKEYKKKFGSRFPKDVKFPTNASEYKSKSFQSVITRLQIDDSSAKEKATLIKLNLPVNEL